MRTAYALLGFLFILLIGALVFFLSGEEESITSNQEESMLILESSVFKHNGAIPSKYTCDGDDVNPPLSISGVPEWTKSLVLIMDDPDAPAGTWDHWIVFNMSPAITDIEEGNEPEGTAGNNSWGKGEYGGPCPPDGEHRYFFKLYALDTELDLGEGAVKSEVEGAMERHILEATEIVGTYIRESNK